MALINELKSLEEIYYKPKSYFLYYFIFPTLILFFCFFINFPVSEKIQSIIKNKMALSACPIHFKTIHFEFLLPKAIISDIKIPGSCLGPEHKDINLNSLKIDWRIVNFFPFGVPFKVSTQIFAQDLEFYLIQSFESTYLKIKDQNIELKRLDTLLGNYKLEGKVTTNLDLTFFKNKVSKFDFKLASKNFIIPSQILEDFKIPELKVGDLFIEATSDNSNKVVVDKLILGSTSSPLRANFKGHFNISSDHLRFSPLLLTGEISFSSLLKSQIPLIDLLFQSFNQKDGFYQIKLGGTLGAPKPLPL